MLQIVDIGAGRGAAMKLSHLGLAKNSQIQLSRKSHMRCPVILIHNGSEIAIGYELARKILVEEV